MTLRAPVFIVGQARSGSSVLYRLVQEHPRFVPAAGLNLSESHLLDTVASSATLDVPSLRSFAGLDDEGWRGLLAALRWNEPRRRLAARVPNRVLQRSVGLWRALGCQAAVRGYLAGAAEARGADRLVEKTPQHLPWARHLVATFPDARLLVITRHPLAAYASFRRRAAEDPAATWADLAPGAFADRWRADVRFLARLVAEAGEQVRVERYEQLVAEPEAVQAALFEWLGEAPLEHLPGAVPVNPHAPPSDATQLFGPVQDLGRSWRDHVTDADAAQLERSLAAPMALLGYRPAAR